METIYSRGKMETLLSSDICDTFIYLTKDTNWIHKEDKMKEKGLNFAIVPGMMTLSYILDMWLHGQKKGEIMPFSINMYFGKPLKFNDKVVLGYNQAEGSRIELFANKAGTIDNSMVSGNNRSNILPYELDGKPRLEDIGFATDNISRAESKYFASILPSHGMGDVLTNFIYTITLSSRMLIDAADKGISTSFAELRSLRDEEGNPKVPFYKSMKIVSPNFIMRNSMKEYEKLTFGRYAIRQEKQFNAFIECRAGEKTLYYMSSEIALVPERIFLKMIAR